MAMRFNWKRIGYGSGALFATLSTAFALGPSSKDRDLETSRIKGNETFCQNETDKPRVIIPSQSCQLQIKGNLEKRKRLEDAIQKSRALCKRVKNEKGLPGLTVAVSVNGKVVWKDGFGFADLENNVRMKPEHIIRIASISKSMTMAMLAKLMEEGKIDIDKPIQTYLPDYPEKYLDGEKVTITTRHLLSHLSGIRHYQKKEEITDNTSDPKDDNVEKKDSQSGNEGVSNKKLKKKKSKDEMSLSEYFFKDKFDSVEESLKMFKDDELLHKPGTKYYYSTHAWSVVSAIIEKLTATEFPKYCTRMFNYWGLKNTYIDLHEPIIYDRARYYTRLKDGVIINSPYVDNSYKWAGGGIISNVIDLNQFANILLYSAQTREDSSQILDENGLPKTPYLKQSTMMKVWTGNPVTARPEVPDNLYGLGFTVMEPLRKCTFCKESNMKLVGHTGGAIGASSVLLIAFPATTNSANCDSLKEDSKEEPVKGVVVSMITNLTSIGLSKTAYEIANNFQELI